MTLSDEQKRRSNELRVQQRAKQAHAKFTIPRDGAREQRVNSLVSSIMKSVLKKARRRHEYAVADVKPYSKLKPESKKKVLSTARRNANSRRTADPEKKKGSDAASYKKHKTKRQQAQHDRICTPEARSKRSEKRKNSPLLQLQERLRRRLHTAMTGRTDRKKTATMKLVGCSREELYTRLGGDVNLHDIDHIFPMVRYNLDTLEGQTRAMNWSNLQLLRPCDNKSKSAKLPTKAMAAKVDPSCWPDGVTMDMLPDIYPDWATPLRMHAPTSPGAGSSADHAASSSSSA